MEAERLAREESARLEAERQAKLLREEQEKLERKKVLMSFRYFFVCRLYRSKLTMSSHHRSSTRSGAN